MKRKISAILSGLFLLFSMALFGDVETASLTARESKSTPAVCEPNPDPASLYTGFDVDFGVGYAAFSSDTTFSNGVGEYQFDMGAPGVALQVRLGGLYGYANSWTVGFELYGQYNSTNPYFEIPAEVITVDTQLIWNIGFDAKFGYVYSTTNMIYVTFGPDWGYLKSKYKNSGVANTTKTFLVAPRFGAGAEQKIFENWLLRESFDAAWYNSKSITNFDGSVISYIPRLYTMLFEVGYQF